jgi:hypothetical protein
MAAMASGSAERVGGFHRIYLLGWLAVAGLAMTYLVLIAIKPDLRRSAARGSEQPEQRTISRLADEMQSVRKSLGDVQMNVAHLRTETASLKERDATVTARLAAIEERAAKLAPSGPITASLDSQATQPSARQPVSKAAPQPAPAATKARPAPTVTAALPTPAEQSGPAAAAPPKQPNVINQQKAAANQVVTGSLPPVPVSLAPPAMDPSGPVALYLGGGPSLEALRLSWSLLSERHGAVLKGTTPRIARAGADGASFDLLAGPVRSTEEARRLCAELRARRAACTVGPLTGDSL